MRSLLIPLVLTAGCAVPIRASMSPKELLDKVQLAEEARDGFSPAIQRAVGAQQPEIRLAAMKALARTEAVGTSSLAAALLGDRDLEVARWAAFALGQIGDATAEAALRAALQSGVSQVPEEVLLALGRCGTTTTARHLTAHLKDERPGVRGNAALAMGLIAKRVPDFPHATFAARIAPLIADRDPVVRYGGVYALMRMPSSVSAVALIPALGDPDPEVRAHAARGVGAAGAAPQVLDPVINDPDWRVRVEVVRSLGTIGENAPEDAPAAAARLAPLIQREFARLKTAGLAVGRSLHILLAIVQAADRLGDQGVRVVRALEQAPWNVEGLPEETTEDLYRLQCAVAYLLDKKEGVVRRVRTCGAPVVQEWRRLELMTRLLALDGSGNAVTALVNLTGHQDPKVRAAAVSAMGDVKREETASALMNLLGSNDPYVASAAAEILSRPDFARFRPTGIVAAIGKVLDALVAQPDAALIVPALDAAGALEQVGRPLLVRLRALVERDARAAVRRRAAAAIARITGQATPFGGRSTQRPYTLPAPIADNVELVIRTRRGDVVLELFGGVAPVATGTLVAQAQSGLYRDQTVHRVVSNFVIQGGCPRGDGWGGPGFTIPGETSPLWFVRGAVGIATNGRDTGGSQFFIMHSRHPHLEGGYSLIGRVVQGIEIVDAIQQDDRIIDVEVRGPVR